MKAGQGLSSASNEGGLRHPAVMGIHLTHLAAKLRHGETKPTASQNPRLRIVGPAEAGSLGVCPSQ